ncbi:MAG: asparaginase [Burkholderiales bacterium]|nr:asparaginase [Burkholderiales bacterium]
MASTKGRVVVLGTGGTIAGTAASATDSVGYQAAQLGVQALVAAVPALAGLPLQAEQVAQIDSKDGGPALWLALLQALRTPGEHAVVFTLVAGKDSDLLDGTLVVAGGPAAGDHGHAHDSESLHGHALERAAWIGAGLLALGLLGGIGWWRQRRRKNPTLAEGAGS